MLTKEGRMSKIKQLKFDNGERYPILLKDDGMPNFWVTLFVTEKLRPVQTQTSITNTLHHLIHLELWEKINNRNIVEEFRQAKFLTNEDIYSIRDHCLLDTRSLKKWIHSSRKNIVRFPAASTLSIAPIQTVSLSHASNRMGQIASFLIFTAHVILKSKLHDGSITDSIKVMSDTLVANKPKNKTGKGLGGDPDTKTPPPKAFEHILAVTKEDSPDNPFKSKEIRFRNALIFEIMDATGMRAGEILALQIRDVDFSEIRNKS